MLTMEELATKAGEHAGDYTEGEYREWAFGVFVDALGINLMTISVPRLNEAKRQMGLFTADSYRLRRMTRSESGKGENP